MAEHDQDNDEYKFAELDSYGHESMDNESTETDSASPEKKHTSERKNIKRNALIALVVIIFAMVMYKLIGMMFTKKSTTETVQTTVPPITQATPQPIEPIATTQTTTPVVQQPQPVVSADTGDLKEKVSVIEQTQLTVKTEISTISEQVGTVNNNINNLNTQIAQLNQVIRTLSDQVNKQSEEIKILMVHARPVTPTIIRPRIMIPRVIYYIQAVIPGRAWLIGSNGSTLTVREGTKIAGYGTVKLIDSIQGRVLTSSGQVIRFSQDDS